MKRLNLSHTHTLFLCPHSPLHWPPAACHLPKGIYFRSNHERLLDELSRAITIIAHGLERLVRDGNITVPDGLSTANAISNTNTNNRLVTISTRDETGDDDDDDEIPAKKMNHEQQQRARQHKLLASHSKCYGPMEEFSERRADLLYE